MHLFGERGFKERISSPISSLFKLTSGGTASKILTLSPKKCMSQNEADVDTFLSSSRTLPFLLQKENYFFSILIDVFSFV